MRRIPTGFDHFESFFVKEVIDSGNDSISSSEIDGYLWVIEYWEARSGMCVKSRQLGCQ